MRGTRVLLPVKGQEQNRQVSEAVPLHNGSLHVPSSCIVMCSSSNLSLASRELHELLNLYDYLWKEGKLGLPPNKPHIRLHYIYKRSRSKVRGNINDVAQWTQLIYTLMEAKVVQSSQFMCPFDWEHSHRLFCLFSWTNCFIPAVASALVFKQGHHLSAAS